jgi:hypothetical protein
MPFIINMEEPGTWRAEWPEASSFVEGTVVTAKRRSEIMTDNVQRGKANLFEANLQTIVEHVTSWEGFEDGEGNEVNLKSAAVLSVMPPAVLDTILMKITGGMVEEVADPLS